MLQIGPRWAYIAFVPGAVYFRLFGYGLDFRNIKKGLSFSERMGLKDYWRIGSLIIRRLKPCVIKSTKIA